MVGRLRTKETSDWKGLGLSRKIKLPHLMFSLNVQTK